MIGSRRLGRRALGVPSVGGVSLPGGGDTLWVGTSTILQAITTNSASSVVFTYDGFPLIEAMEVSPNVWEADWTPLGQHRTDSVAIGVSIDGRTGASASVDIQLPMFGSATNRVFYFDSWHVADTAGALTSITNRVSGSTAMVPVSNSPTVSATGSTNGTPIVNFVGASFNDARTTEAAVVNAAKGNDVPCSAIFRVRVAASETNGSVCCWSASAGGSIYLRLYVTAGAVILERRGQGDTASLTISATGSTQTQNIAFIFTGTQARVGVQIAGGSWTWTDLTAFDRNTLANVDIFTLGIRLNSSAQYGLDGAIEAGAVYTGAVDTSVLEAVGAAWNQHFVAVEEVAWMMSDLHADTDATLIDRAVDYAIANDPTFSALIIPGDATVIGASNQYTTLASGIAGRADPTHVVRPKAAMALGNHDIYVPENVANFDSYFSWQSAHNAGSGSFRYCTFTSGGLIRWVILDSETGWTDDQIDWLDGFLYAATEPWVIPVIHELPIKCTSIGWYGQDVYEPNCTVLAEIFELCGIRLVIGGHEHTYARWHPVTAGVRDDAAGVNYLTCGTAGSSVFLSASRSGIREVGDVSTRLDTYDLELVLGLGLHNSIPPLNGNVISRLRATPFVLTVETYRNEAGGLGDPIDTFTLTRRI